MDKNIASKSHNPGISADFDNYVLVQEIGEGAFGAILKVKHKHTGQYFACKVEKQTEINEILVKKQYLLLLQLNETRLFPKVQEFVQFPQHSYIVMELLGPNLYTKSKRFGKLSVRTVALVAKDMFKSLEILHKNHILHRDLKPENILLTLDGHNVKLIDFGLSKTCKQQLPRRTISIIGNVRYSSFGAHLGYSSKKDDLESMCYVMIYLATGKLPWQNLPEQKIKQQLDRRNSEGTHYEETELLMMKKNINIDMFKDYTISKLERCFLQELIKITKVIQGLNREQEPDYHDIHERILKLIFIGGADEDDCHEWCPEFGCPKSSQKTERGYARFWSVYT